MKNSDEIKKEYDLGERLEMEKYSLIIFFLIQQRWAYAINKEFSKDQITIKQWLFLIVLGNAFTYPPSMQEMAKAMSTSHQNVKQIAARLEDKEMLKIERDPANKRILRLKVTEKYYKFWKNRDESDIKSIAKIFDGLTNEEVKNLFEIIAKLDKSSLKLYEDYKNMETLK